MLLHRSSPLIARLLAVTGAMCASLALAGTEAGPRPTGTRQPPAGTASTDGVARVIVQYRAGSGLMQPLSAASDTTRAVRPQHASTMSARLGLPLRDGRVLGERMQALRGQGVSSAELAARLAAQDDVEWAVVDGRRLISAVPNDPFYGPNQPASLTNLVAGQWYLRSPDSTIVSAINAVGAWDVSIGSSAVTVAVLDTGVRFDHPDFTDKNGKSKLYAGYDFVTDTCAAGDGDGRDANAEDPGDWTTAGVCGDSSSTNSSWHGTLTAGLIGAATDNAVGIASVGHDVMILPVRVLGKGGGIDSDIIAGMRWAAGLSSDPVVNSHPAKVLNLSFGSSGSCSPAYQGAMSELVAAGVTVVVAAGNEAGLAVATPANCTGALAVTGLRHLGTKVGFSSIGPQVAIAAPGGNCVNTNGGPCLYSILTTTNLGTTTPSTNGYSDSTRYEVGTSFAAPMVAGTAALMLAVDPTLTPAQIKAKLQSSARRFPTTGSDPSIVACQAPNGFAQDECYCTTTTCGAGMLDAAAAVASVSATTVAPPSAVINASSSSVTAGASVTLASTGSGAYGNRSLSGYQWAITSGGTLASFSGSTTGSSATLATTGAGSVTVSLTVTDSAGVTGSTSSTITIQAAASPTTTPSATPSSPGGGAASPLWLALLAAATLAMAGTGRGKRTLAPPEAQLRDEPRTA